MGFDRTPFDTPRAERLSRTATAMTSFDRTIRLLSLLPLRLLAPVFPPLQSRFSLKGEGRQAGTGIEGSVPILRAPLGVPTIRARAPADLFFGFGYAIAQDRLWQMDLYRRVAGGRLAEILGDRPLPVKPG